MLDKALGAGSDNVDYFGGNFVGGYTLQQAPDEFAALCLLLQRRPIVLYGEIGIASGGSLRFISEHVGFNEAIVIDDGKHARAAEQQTNLAEFRKQLQLFTGDSHTIEAGRFLDNACIGREFDAMFIDGDHTYAGLRQDVNMVLPYCQPSTRIIFHDTIAVPDIGKLVDELVINEGFKLHAHFAANEITELKRTMGIAVCSIA